MAARRLRSTVVAALAGGCLVFAACSGGEWRPASLKGATPVADQSDGRLAMSVVPPSAEFHVVFAWKHGSPAGGTGAFIWSQAGGARRWDLTPDGASNAGIGWFSVESEFGPAGAPASAESCLWEVKDLPQVTVGCDTSRPSQPGADALTRASTALRLTGRLPDRTIAGRDAECYALQDTRTDLGVICVERQTGIPLYFAATGEGRNKATHEFEATDVGSPPVSITAPDLHEGTILAPVQRPVSALQLPAEIHAGG